MKADEAFFASVMNGSKQFVVPIFQRDYSWTEPHCEQLWNDIMTAGTTSQPRHFMGSIVYVVSPDASARIPQWLLIDGQQRLTTLALLLAALRTRLRAGAAVDADLPGPDEVEEHFLVNRHGGADLRHKLRLRRADDATLRALLEGQDLPENPSARLVENHDFFSERLAEADLRSVHAGIRKLMLVDVRLTQGEDDPQLIFESLNSTGLDLTQADLIRNYVLMRRPEPEQTRLYERWWHPIEALYRESPATFDAFARDHAALHSGSTTQTRADQVHGAFRRFFQDREASIGIDASLDELLRYARHHARFVHASSAGTGLDGALGRVHALAAVAGILVMRLLECHRSGRVAEGELCEILGTIENYILRRSVCGLQSRGYWDVFAALAQGVRDAAPADSVRVGIALLRRSYRFPDDREFEASLLERDMYPFGNCHFLLSQLENRGEREPSPTRTYSIEHVLPQNPKLDRGWQEMLGPQWKEVQSAHLHRLGNLTLTGYNPKYSDKPLGDKQTIAHGFRDSAVRLNKDIAHAPDWTPTRIEERGRRLAQRALEIWGPLVVDEAAIVAARRDELMARAAARGIDQVQMSERARELFATLRPAIKALDDSTIELAETGSISYHAAEFFLEVLPRKRRLVLLLAPAFDEISDPTGQAMDATQWTFFTGAHHSGGTCFWLDAPGQLDAAMGLVRQAWEAARA